jgi:hypothetical protein
MEPTVLLHSFLSAPLLDRHVAQKKDPDAWNDADVNETQSTEKAQARPSNLPSITRANAPDTLARKLVMCGEIGPLD